MFYPDTAEFAHYNNPEGRPHTEVRVFYRQPIKASIFLNKSIKVRLFSNSSENSGITVTLPKKSDIKAGQLVQIVAGVMLDGTQRPILQAPNSSKKTSTTVREGK